MGLGGGAELCSGAGELWPDIDGWLNLSRLRRLFVRSDGVCSAAGCGVTVLALGVTVAGRSEPLKAWGCPCVIMLDGVPSEERMEAA